ncbi:hypothetical protein NGTWS1702_20650 [Mycolicibacterium cyprinidarum]|uniref:Uncharacterized protein n=1 Tax=Mycolicibacterium cyprinidarum TaxID=2860311 RepID=A0ABQ4VAR9_9MYCO|nr:hypothetical protein NGTWS1702_20650 [Mycolicibacterium sp. NGTWSNA01]
MRLVQARVGLPAPMVLQGARPRPVVTVVLVVTVSTPRPRARVVVSVVMVVLVVTALLARMVILVALRVPRVMTVS